MSPASRRDRDDKDCGGELRIPDPLQTSERTPNRGRIGWAVSRGERSSFFVGLDIAFGDSNDGDGDSAFNNLALFTRNRLCHLSGNKLLAWKFFESRSFIRDTRAGIGTNH